MEHITVIKLNAPTATLSTVPAPGWASLSPAALSRGPCVLPHAPAASYLHVDAGSTSRVLCSATAAAGLGSQRPSEQSVQSDHSPCRVMPRSAVHAPCLHPVATSHLLHGILVWCLVPRAQHYTKMRRMQWTPPSKWGSETVSWGCADSDLEPGGRHSTTPRQKLSLGSWAAVMAHCTA